MRASIILVLCGVSVACTPSHPPDKATEPVRTVVKPAPTPSASPGPASSLAAPGGSATGGRGRQADLAPPDAGPGDGGQRPTRPDADIVRDIERTIRENGVLTAQGAKVNVTCDRGEVTLRGSVKDEAARASVTAMVRKTPGVLRINDLLKPVDPHPTDWNPDDPKY
jgi:hypothetical protein